MSGEIAALAHEMRQNFGVFHPSPLRLLLADDCPVQQLLACLLLSAWNVMPQIACDGFEAVLLAGVQDFDLILMDIEMPVMDGLTATMRIRQQEQRRRFRAVPVVAYTASDLSGNAAQWQTCGMSAVLKKPSAIAEMGACLERWCPAQLAAARH